MYRPFKSLIVVLCILLVAACEPATETEATKPEVVSQDNKPTAAEAALFVAEAEEQLARTGQHSERSGWVLANFITEDTEQLAAKAAEQYTAAQVEMAARSARFNGVDGLDYDTERKLNLLRSSIVMPAPGEAAKTAEQAEIGTRLRGIYGKGTWCNEAGVCMTLGELEEIMAHSRDPAALLETWEGWRTVSPPMKDLYARQVELANEGAAEVGFDNLGTMWRSAYDMNPADFPAELDRVWGQVKPLYDALHCHVRARLSDRYGPDVVPPDGPIPAHLLGNMWAQSWDNIYDIVGPGRNGCRLRSQCHIE